MKFRFELGSPGLTTRTFTAIGPRELATRPPPYVVGAPPPTQALHATSCCCQDAVDQLILGALGLLKVGAVGGCFEPNDLDVRCPMAEHDQVKKQLDNLHWAATIIVGLTWSPHNHDASRCGPLALQ